MYRELVAFCEELALSESEVAAEEFAEQRFVE